MQDPLKLSYCSECGEARVPHPLYKAQFYINPVMDALVRPLDRMTAALTRSFLRHDLDRYVLPICRTLARMRLGTLKDSLDPRDSIRTKSLFEGAAAAGVTLYEFRLFNFGEDGIFIARRGSMTLVFTTMPRPRLFRSPSLQWMDDKGILKPFLLAHSIPTAAGGVASTQRQARAIFDSIGPSVIVKPHKGTRGRHTTISIRTPEELAHAFAICKQISPYAIVEKELSGIVHRVTLIGGKPVAIIRRDYPHVIGDGVSTIEELLAKENTDPRRDDFAFYRIAHNERAEEALRKQSLAWSTIPAAGERVILNDKVSRLHGTVTVDVTDGVHPDNLELFERIGTVMGDPLIGVDFMIGDMARPWTEQPGCGLVECNAMPYIDLHHYVYEGKARNVAKALWEYVFDYGSYQKPRAIPGVVQPALKI